MKAFVVFAVFVWFLCGFVGAWMMGAETDLTWV